MKSPRLGPAAALLATAVFLFTASTSAFADSYQIFLLEGASFSPTAIHYPVGITASGAVVIFDDPTDCNGTPGGCYETFKNGVSIGKSRTYPDLTYDNGVGCAPNASFPGTFTASICNSGREVYGTYINSVLYNGEIFTGPDPVADFFASGQLASAYLNSSGDFVYLVNAIGESNGSLYEAIDLTTETPEPSSIFLLGTGLFGFAGVFRRRLFQ